MITSLGILCVLTPVKLQSLHRDSNVTWIGKREEKRSDGFTHYASIWCRYDKSWSFNQWCSGVFIHAEWVLTAAHCLDVGSDEIHKILVNYKQSKVGPEADHLKPAAVFTYANYGFPTDIALIQLKQAVPESDVKPAQLPKPGEDEAYVDTRVNATLVTFAPVNIGLDGKERTTKEEGKVVVSETELFNEECYSGEFYPFDFDRQLCTQLNETYGIKYCRNDAGAPATVMKEGKPLLLGIISHITYVCSDPTIYHTDSILLMTALLRTESFMPWILKTMAGTSKGVPKTLKSLETAWQAHESWTAKG